MGVHDVIDAYVVMTELSGHLKHPLIYFSCGDSGYGDPNYRQNYPYTSTIIYVNSICLYESFVVFLISRHVTNVLRLHFDSKEIQYSDADYRDMREFRVKMTPEQIVDFHSNFVQIMKKIEGEL